MHLMRSLVVILGVLGSGQVLGRQEALLLHRHELSVFYQHVAHPTMWSTLPKSKSFSVNKSITRKIQCRGKVYLI
jgi:hypothetical protein